MHLHGLYQLRVGFGYQNHMEPGEDPGQDLALPLVGEGILFRGGLDFCQDLSGGFIGGNGLHKGLTAVAVVAPGNHDFSNCEGDYNTYLKRFVGYSNAFMDYKITTPYFYRVVDGYYFIVVSSEDITWEYLAISEAQYEWLEGVIAEAKQSGKPVFVFSHFPIDLEQSGDDRLSDILNDCDNLLYFYGHTHNGLDEYTAWTYNGVNCINISKTTETTDYDCGTGAYVEVHEDEILVKIKDFHDEMWYDDYVYSYPIK